MSATSLTSIQHFGTATTTSARPNPKRLQERHALGGVGDVLAHQVLAGDAQVRVPAIELGDDLGGGDERHLDAGDILDLAAIAAVVARLAQLEAGAGEKLAPSAP